MQPEEFAALVTLTVKSLLGPVLERISAAEARIAMLPAAEKTIGELRDRLVVVETKSAMPSAPVVPLPETVPVDLSPVLDRLSAVETKHADLKDRVLVVETKAAIPVAVPVPERLDETPLIDLRERVASLERRVQDDPLTKELGALRERVAVIEVRPPVPGPPGEPGPPGKDGLNGKDGTAGLTYQGVYQAGKTYDVGDVTTYASSSWHCNEQTTTVPGDGSKAWTLMVKRGRDGKDGRDAPSLPVVTVGRTP